MSATIHKLRDDSEVPARCTFCGSYIPRKFKQRGALRLHRKWICSACALILEYYFESGECHLHLEAD